MYTVVVVKMRIFCFCLLIASCCRAFSAENKDQALGEEARLYFDHGSESRLENHGEKIVPSLIESFTNANAAAKRRVLERIFHSGTSNAVPLLIKGLEDAERQVRSAAVSALHNQRTEILLPQKERLVPPLIRYCKSETYYGLDLGILVLGRIGSSALIPELQQVKQKWLIEYEKKPYHPLPKDVVRAARGTLARFGSAEDRSEIREMLKSEDVQKVREGIDHVDRGAGRSMAKDLVPLLDDTREGIDMGTPHTPAIVRVCDYAAAILNNLFDMKLQDASVEDTLEQVKSRVAQLPELK